MRQAPCSALVTTLFPDSVQINPRATVHLPQAENIRKIGFPNAVDDGPIKVRCGSIKRNLQLLADFTTGPICSNQVFGIDLLCLPSFEVLQRCADRMGSRVIPGFILLHHRGPFNICIVSKEISNIYALNLALRADMGTAVFRIGLK